MKDRHCFYCNKVVYRYTFSRKYTCNDCQIKNRKNWMTTYKRKEIKNHKFFSDCFHCNEENNDVPKKFFCLKCREKIKEAKLKKTYKQF